MKYTKSIYMLIFFCCLSFFTMNEIHAQNPDPIGGAGICVVNQNPNNMTSISDQDERYECQIVKDTTANKLYVYLSGSKTWDEIDLQNNIVSLANGTNVNITDDGNGNYTINVLDEIPIGGTINQLLTSDGSGGFTWEDPQAQFTTTNSDNIEFDYANGVLTSEVIIDVETGNLLETTNTGLKVNNPLSNLTIADSHSDAASKGVPIGGTFEISSTNTMGMVPGIPINRKF